MNKEYFKENILKYQNEDKRLSTVYNRISAARTLSFVVALVAAIYYADVRNGSAIFLVVGLFLISFVLLVKWHNRVKHARNHAQFLKKINEDELTRLAGDLSSFDTGEDFKSNSHYYSGDLDIFGQNSLFQLLNRTTTITGRKMLSNWLLSPATKEDIEKRQEAIKELKVKPGFCQNFQAIGLHFKDVKASFDPLKEWIEEPVKLKGNKLLIASSYVLPIITVTLLAGLIWFNVSFGFFMASLLVNGLVLKKVLSYSLKIAEQTGKGVSTLSAIAQLIPQVENSVFKSRLLNEIKNDLMNEGILSSTQIKRLVKILDFFNARANMFYGIFDLIFLLDIHLIYWAEKWKITNRENVQKWFDSISKFEVLVSFSQFSHANPEYVVPEIVEDEYQFETNEMGHPLIKVNERIHNNFQVENKGKVVII
ncbi:MAG: hypothetical protein OEW67_12405, partial [Cyclobacteriaceae bacterium]|nr:hypothetical protein [Cyclobacteriaceae bacterium]